MLSCVSLAPRRLVLRLLRLRERGEQRLSLGDLGHLRRRRKAFERGREDRLGFGGAVGRLVELGERERGAQAEAVRPLFTRNGNGGQERLFSRRGVGGIALEQHFTADAMQFGVERAMTDPFGRR